ncbi:MAG: glutamate 5-kinase, partial [Proteobacteria bacterium]|nr:glutamate 5-kinase [Pseudomonadota bacterium]
GITRVEGGFAQNALISIKLGDGSTLGVGLTNFSSEDLERIKGEKTSEIETILGRASCEEAVHRDKMLLDPALKEQ